MLLVPSDRDPDRHYQVWQDSTGRWRCNCPGFTTWNRCKHSLRQYLPHLTADQRATCITCGEAVETPPGPWCDKCEKILKKEYDDAVALADVPF